MILVTRVSKPSKSLKQILQQSLKKLEQEMILQPSILRPLIAEHHACPYPTFGILKCGNGQTVLGQHSVFYTVNWLDFKVYVKCFSDLNRVTCETIKGGKGFLEKFIRVAFKLIANVSGCYVFGIAPLHVERVR